MYNLVMVAKKNLVNWEAREYIAHDKNVGWYIGFAVVVIALIALSCVLKQWSFLALVVCAAIALLLYTVRKPRVLHYSLDDDGLTEGNNLYIYEDFRAFGVLIEDNHCSIVLLPKKRFAAAVTVYFPETSGEEIVDIFGEHLPMESVKLDVIDKLVRLLRI